MMYLLYRICPSHTIRRCPPLHPEFAHFVEGDDPELMHQAMAAALDAVLAEIQQIRQDARRTGRPNGRTARPTWPMIVLRSPKGWTGPKVVDGLPVEGTWRAHQVPIAEARGSAEHRALLETWLRSYRPDELFDERGALRTELAELAPRGERRMGANPHANGGARLRPLRLPDFREYALAVDVPGTRSAESVRALGALLE